MISNRSVPAASVIPVLAYADVAEASEWLCNAFGFTERLRIGTHRAQLVFADGAVIVTEVREPGGSSTAAAHSVHVRVEDADRHHDRAASHGARIPNPPTDYPYGERQYTAEDPGGHRWTFSQWIADVDPASWGATNINIEKGDGMVARVATFEGVNVQEAERTMDEAEAAVRQLMEGLAGYQGYIQLISSGGKVMSITFFDTMANAEAAEPTFDEDMPRQLGHIFEAWEGRRTSVDRYNVAAESRS